MSPVDPWPSSPHQRLDALAIPDLAMTECSNDLMFFPSSVFNGALTTSWLGRLSIPMAVALFCPHAGTGLLRFW